MTISAALIEPDENRRQTLMRIVHESLGTISTLAVYTFQTARAFHYAFIEKRFRADILLLRADDAHFAFGRQIRDRDTRCVILFLDGYMDAVLKSLASMPIAYLVRESQPDALRQALLLAHSHLMNLEAYMENEDADNARAIFRHETRFQMIRLPFHEIDYFESDLRRVIIHKADMTSESFPGKLDEIQQRCMDNFYRTHQSYLINMDHVERIDKAQRRILFFSGNEAFISRQNYLGFLKAYESQSQEVGRI